MLDDERGMRLGTQHLIDLGHSRIAFLSGVPTSDSAARREAGFRAAMAAAGLPVPADHVTRLGYDPRSGGAALTAVAALRPPPTADTSRESDASANRRSFTYPRRSVA